MNLAIFGATGSIGASTLDVVARHPERYRVFALTRERLGRARSLELCRRHRPRYAVLSGVAEDRGAEAPVLQNSTPSCCSVPRRSRASPRHPETATR